MKRSTKCNEFLDRNEVNCCSMVNDQDEGRFSMSGCGCCETGLGDTVYDCNGYAPKTKEVVELGAVCGECLNYFYNGEDSQIESA